MSQPEIDKPIRKEEIKLSKPKPEETKKMPELYDPGKYYLKDD